MKINISGQVLCEKYEIDEAISFMKKSGCDGMEIWPTCIEKGVQTYINFSPEQIAGVKEKMDANGVYAACVSFAGAFNQQLCEDPAEYAKELCAAVEAAKILQAKYVNHYCYYLSLHEYDEQKLLTAMLPALKLAEEYGIILVLENEAHDLTKTPEGMLKIINLFNSANFKTNYDATNYYHGRQEGFPNAYDVLKGHIAYIHLKNGRMKDDIVYTSIADGAVNINGVVNKSLEDNYTGYYTLEPHCKKDNIEEWLLKDINYVKEIFK